MTLAPYERSAPYYDLIYEPIVDYGRECDLLEEVFLRHVRREVRRILDLGSGTGNHALLLTDRGYEVVGVDLQPAFVERAREKARGRGRTPTFLVGDMRRLEVEGPFDAILCMSGPLDTFPGTTPPRPSGAFGSDWRRGVSWCSSSGTRRGPRTATSTGTNGKGTAFAWFASPPPGSGMADGPWRFGSSTT